ncbi:ABC transporter permease subunit [Plesiomonas shigelloides subsp. oncorhynchi]|nr:ABC transporter permease subunit [Plesiomonas shigelloides]
MGQRTEQLSDQFAATGGGHGGLELIARLTGSLADGDVPLSGPKMLQWALCLPLALPGYLVAYLYTDLLDFSGPVQGSLRALFGWQTLQDYWFPPIRTLGGACLILALVLYPYIYLLTRTALMEQSSTLLQSARLLRASPWQVLWRVCLPLARPAIAVGHRWWRWRPWAILVPWPILRCRL